MAKKKSDISPMIGGKSAIKPNKTIGNTTGSVKISKKPRKSLGSNKVLKTVRGNSGIMNPPTGGGY